MVSPPRCFRLPFPPTKIPEYTPDVVILAFLGLPMSVSLLSRRLSSTGVILFACRLAAGQAGACPAVPAHTPTPAETAYGNALYADAESLYTQALTQHPQNVELSAALIHVLLREWKLGPAETQATALVAAQPNSAPALTALAEVQLRLGQPGPAGTSLEQAASADPCYAQAHLVRSQLLRIESTYASERTEIQHAYDIDPSDPDIQQAWQSIDSTANQIKSIDSSLATMNDLDAATRQKAVASIHDMMPLLYEHSQTCQVVPSAPSAELPLEAFRSGPKEIEGYRLQVELGESKLKLLVDTAASGLYISNTIAAQNGFKQGPDDPPGTVHVDSFRVGPLEFRDCTVGVSVAPFSGSPDGFIGTDLFSPWMITLDLRLDKLLLSPLPAETGVLPGDRSRSPELAGFTPVYRRRQYFLVPITFKDNSQKLFILGTGMRNSAMTSEAAHSVSNMKVNFTNSEQTASGGKIQFFREVFDMKFANQPQIHQGHIVEFDPVVVDRNAGFQIAGMMGLDILRQFTLRLDYRDGLVEFAPVGGEENPTLKARNSPDESSPACQLAESGARSVNTTIEATVPYGLDSAQLKPGKQIWIKTLNRWLEKSCELDTGSNLYGHVMDSSSTKKPDSSEVSILFDHADCVGHSNLPITLRLIGLVAPPDAASRMHDALPTEVAGAGRQVSDAAAATGGFAFDDNLNPGGPPHTVVPGVVIRMPKMKLEPVGGPGCSARITSSERSVRLGAGSEMIFSVEGGTVE